MGESQCPTCHHIVTGFEQDDFEAGLAVLAAKDAEIERLRGALDRIAFCGAGEDYRALREIARTALAGK